MRRTLLLLALVLALAGPTGAFSIGPAAAAPPVSPHPSAPGALPPPVLGSASPSAALTTPEHWVNVSQEFPTSPPALQFPAMTFDPARSEDILFGGNTSGGLDYASTWAFTNGSWTDLTPTLSGAPPALRGSAMTYDPDAGGLLLFGGILATGRYSNQTWLLGADGWQNLTSGAGSAPPATAFAGIAFDPDLPGTVLVGGARGPGAPTNATWRYNDGGWTDLTASTHAPATLGLPAGVAYDPSIPAVVAVFAAGGITSSGSLATAELAGGSWSVVPTTTAPPARVAAALVFDLTNSSLILFGGASSNGRVGADTWSFAAGAWTNRTTEAAGLGQLPTEGAGVAYDTSEHVVVLYGGYAYTGGWDEPFSWFLSGGAFPDPFIATDRAVTDILVVVHFSVTFLGNATAPFSYSWSFGDGTLPVAGPSPGHSYGLVGNYTVTLTVTDGAGTVGYSNGLLEQILPKPSAISADATPEISEAGVAVQFIANATGGLAPYVYNWSWDDGTNGSGATTSHVFPRGGTFEVAVVGTDVLGGTIRTVLPVVIHDALACSIGAPVVLGEVGSPLAFSAGTSGGVGPYTSVWTYGDGSSSGGSGASHVYSAAGVYPLTLTSTDALSVVCTASLNLTILGPLASTASASISTTDVGQPIAFTGGVVAGAPPYTYSWAFGDGQSSSLAAPSHAFATAGGYSVLLTTYDSAGASVTSGVRVTIDPLPSVHLGATTQLVTAGSSITFTGAGTAGTGPFGYAWTFGDGGTGSGGSVTHTFTTAGTFHIAVVATDAVGVNASASISVTVQPPETAGTAGPGAAGPTPLELGAGLAIAAVVVVAAVALLVRRRRSRGEAPPGEAVEFSGEVDPAGAEAEPPT